MSTLPFDPRIATATDLQDLLKKRTVTSVQLVEIYLEQIARYDGYLHAVIATAPRSDILEKARCLDKEREEGKLRSPLHGIPILIKIIHKDNIATHPEMGMDTTAGSLALVGSRPKKNADIVDKLIAAGTLIIGKANLSELSYFKGEDLLCGWSAVGSQCQSAYARGGVKDEDGPAGHSNPGGSSAGSAVAVSAGLAPISIGTETSGSLILPASRAALYTLKPTIGVVSQDGIVPISAVCDSAGPMTKNVMDLVHLMAVISDPSSAGAYAAIESSPARLHDWSDIRVGALNTSIWKPSEEIIKTDVKAIEEMNQAFEDAYAKIGANAKSFHRDIPMPTKEALELNGKSAEWTLIVGQFQHDLEAYLAGLEKSSVRTLEELIQFNRDHADQELPPRYPNQKRLEEALSHEYTAADLEQALAHARKISRTEGIDKMLREYDIDVIIGPAESAMPKFAAASASMPLGYLDLNGRPFAMAAIASAHQEAVLIKVQSAWEATFGPRKPPPYEVFSQSS